MIFRLFLFDKLSNFIILYFAQWYVLWYSLQHCCSDIRVEKDSVPVGFMADTAGITEFFVYGESTGEELNCLVDCPSITLFPVSIAGISFQHMSRWK